MEYLKLYQCDRYLTHAATATITPNEDNFIHDAVGLTANIVLTLNPFPAGGCFNGICRTFKNSSTFVVRLFAGTGVSFDGNITTAARYAILPGECLTLKTTSGTDAWLVVQKQPSSYGVTASGTGALTQITIPHSLARTPVGLMVSATNAAASGITFYTADANNIYVNYSVAPVAGTNNLSYNIFYTQ